MRTLNIIVFERMQGALLVAMTHEQLLESADEAGLIISIALKPLQAESSVLICADQEAATFCTPLSDVCMAALGMFDKSCSQIIQDWNDG